MNWIKNKIEEWKNSQYVKNQIKTFESRYYKPKSNSIIKILSEIENKAGLSPYDIVPYLIKIKLMSDEGSMIEKDGNGKIVTDRKRNTELFSELEQLGFIRVIENKLYSFYNDTRFPTPTKDCVLRVKLLPKGIDYLIEHKKGETEYYFKMVTIVLLAITFLVSIPQACNNWEQYKILTKKEKPNKKESTENTNQYTKIQNNNGSITKVKAIKKKPMSEI